ncbi:MAG: GNAT family N-acetyltransferase [Gammaproteobacteria bacterium]|nr:GNAT family N-acetyltransferase [Gammaproteobacteria bacterium]
MNIHIEVLRDEAEDAYECLLANAPQALLYHSVRYRSFLQRILKNARSHYLVAYHNGQLVAALPSFIMQGPLGAVVNSLPFYGSYGSIVSLPDVSLSVKRALFLAFEKFCKDNRAICSTIIATPTETDAGLFGDYATDFVDDRIGQITPFPKLEYGDNAKTALMDMFHSKTRNMVRKGAKAGFNVGHDGSLATLSALYELHYDNMRSIGGMPKPWKVFEAIRNSFRYDEDYRVYYATNVNGKVVSALLLFYFNGVVEYFIPATHKESRTLQPSSYIILVAMIDAMSEKGARYWNWGGTWLTQDGVYKFKSRWGTKDYPYRYYVREYLSENSMRRNSRSHLLACYPFFYTIPFSALDADE